MRRGGDITLERFFPTTHLFMVSFSFAYFGLLPVVSPNTTLQTPRPLCDYLPGNFRSSETIAHYNEKRISRLGFAGGDFSAEAMPFLFHEADDLLRSKMNRVGASLDKSNTERLLRILEFVVLAIVQAVAFTKRNKWTIWGYLAAFERDRQNPIDNVSREFQDSQGPRRFSDFVLRMWK